MIEQEATGRLATARLTAHGNDPDDVTVDLIFATAGIEREIVEQATDLEVWPGTLARVARIGHLIALKLLSRDMKRRPQDQVDLVNLINAADAEERALAFEAARLIEERGFARDRRLVEDLERLLAELSD